MRSRGRSVSTRPGSISSTSRRAASAFKRVVRDLEFDVAELAIVT
jgi:hypothetical protein